MNWKSSGSAIENARSVLAKMLAKYLKNGRKAADGQRSPEELHDFRIETKRFRYTAELFHRIYGAALERELEPVKELQSVLGKLHDFHVIAERLKRDKALQGGLERLTKKKLKEFHQQWEAFDSKGRLEQWERLLTGRPAKSGAVRSKRKTR